MKETKLQTCRQIFCDFLNEYKVAVRQPIIQNFMDATGITKTCAATYYQTIKKEMSL